MSITVSITTQGMPPEGWRFEKQVPKGTTVAGFKNLLRNHPGAPKITSDSRIFSRSASGLLLKLEDDDRVRRSMILTDVSQMPPGVDKEAQAGKEQSSAASGKDTPAVAAAKSTPHPFPRGSEIYPGSEITPAVAETRQPSRPAVASTRLRKAVAGMESLHWHSSAEVSESTDLQEKIVRVLTGNWPAYRGKSSGSTSYKFTLEVLQDQLQLAKSFEDGSLNHAAMTFYKLFEDDATGPVDLEDPTNLFATLTKSKIPGINQVILTSANTVFKLFRPLLVKYGYSDSPEGFFTMQRHVLKHAAYGEARRLIASIQYAILFGDGDRAGLERRPFNDRVTIHYFWFPLQQNNTHIGASISFYLNHLGLPPLQRFRLSLPRTIAWLELLLERRFNMEDKNLLKLRTDFMKQNAADPDLGFPRPGQRCYTVIFKTKKSYLEAVSQAREGCFEDVAAFKSAPEVFIRLAGEYDWLSEDDHSPTGSLVDVRGDSYDLKYLGLVTKHPRVYFMVDLRLGVLDEAVYEHELCYLLYILAVCDYPPFICLYCYCQEEAGNLELLLHCLRVNFVWQSEPRHMRNLYSTMAGSPDVDYDKYGWFVCIQGCRDRPFLAPFVDNPALRQDMFLHVKSLKQAMEPAEHERPQQENEAPAAAESAEATVTDAPAPAEGSTEPKRPSKTSVVFWGILDVKYDSTKNIEQSTKVLETGDGRRSQFSGYGAAIKEKFHSSEKLEEGMRRSVLTENKLLTHDTVLDCGYGHLRPRQMFFRREYSDGLADKIQELFGVTEDDIIVLKLCNRERGAGVIPVEVSDLDLCLQHLLNIPDDIEEWLKSQPPDWARTVSSSSFTEQVRHWWSNECPIFLVEEFCMSKPIEQEGRQYDGTMRVGFSLHRESRDKLPAGWMMSADGPVYIGDPAEQEDTASDQEEKPRPWCDPRPFLDLFRPQAVTLRVKWLGGYWKLPVEDVNSKLLRDRVVSVAKKGTAPVPDADLHEIYANLGDMVCQLFNSQELSHTSVTKKYADDPELGAFLACRLACEMSRRDKGKSQMVMSLYQDKVAKLPCSLPRDTVLSYIYRNMGVAEAQAGHWQQAEESFKKSLKTCPANATTYYWLGMKHLFIGNMPAAIRALEDSLMLDPDFKHPYVNIGVARLKEGDYEHAQEVSEAGLARHPRTGPLRYNLGIALFSRAYMWEHELMTPEELAEEQEERKAEDGQWHTKAHFREVHTLEFFESFWSTCEERRQLTPTAASDNSAASLSALPNEPSASSKSSRKPAPPQLPNADGKEPVPSGVKSTYSVVHDRVFVRDKPSVRGSAIGVIRRGTHLRGTPHTVGSEPWLLVQDGINESGIKLDSSTEAWVLIDGRSVGLNALLKKVPEKIEVAITSRDGCKVILLLKPDATVKDARLALNMALGVSKPLALLHFTGKNSSLKLQDKDAIGGNQELVLHNIFLGHFASKSRAVIAPALTAAKSPATAAAAPAAPAAKTQVAAVSDAPDVQRGESKVMNGRGMKPLRGYRDKKAFDLRARAVAALEAAKELRPRDQAWREQDEMMLEALRNHSERPLMWEDPLPREGWRTFHARP